LKKLVFVNVLLALMLSGCAGAAYHPVEPSRVVSTVDRGTEKTPAKVLVKRQNTFPGSALDGRFTINGELIVTLSRGETYEFEIKPGTYNFGVKSIQPVLLVPVPFFREQEVFCEAGKLYEFLLFSTGGAGLAIDLAKSWE